MRLRIGSVIDRVRWPPPPRIGGGGALNVPCDFQRISYSTIPAERSHYRKRIFAPLCCGGNQFAVHCLTLVPRFPIRPYPRSPGISMMEGLRQRVVESLTHASLCATLWAFAERVITDSALIQHCRRVDANLERLLQSKVGGDYSNHEALLLTSAAAWHDVLKLNPALCCHMDHGAAAASRLPGFSDLIGIDNVRPILSMVASIIRIHDQGSIRSVPPSVSWQGNTISLPRLALLFKIADMLDCSADRINSLRLMTGLEEKGSKENARLGIFDWELLGQDAFRILLAPSDSIQMKDAMIAVHLMDAELRQHQDALHLFQIPDTMIPRLLPSASNPHLARSFTDCLSSITADDLPDNLKFPVLRHSGILVAFACSIPPRKVLLHWKREWKQWILPSVPMPFSFVHERDFVRQLIMVKYGLHHNEFSLEDLGEVFFDQKMSLSHNCMTEYSFRIALVRLKRRSRLTRESFTLRNERYEWRAIADCRNDDKMQATNAQVWRQVEELIAQQKG